ncbi:hypothetical protein BLNAU_14011 [Blattamonas nauphoetae]|uniref:PPM-type phosphatase domain-containing protein n=1 Tax=Blattamonas nauphoetae TaxID=2049346 RepID=A0ABQ9XHY1_9EUKA|nr:hypothetical protein BLNAU_14011 [Blattamonas nauphoetae]
MRKQSMKKGEEQRCSLCYPPLPESAKSEKKSVRDSDSETKESSKIDLVSIVPAAVDESVESSITKHELKIELTAPLLPFSSPPTFNVTNSPSSPSVSPPISPTISPSFAPNALATDLSIFPVGIAETCGTRTAMEDAILLVPIDGWDLDGLVCDGEWDTIERLLTLPNELRLTRTGMEAMTEREELLNPSAFSTHFHPTVHCGGLFGVFDGHKGPVTSHFLSAEFVHTFIAVGKRLTLRVKEREKLGQKLPAPSFDPPRMLSHTVPTPQPTKTTPARLSMPPSYLQFSRTSLDGQPKPPPPTPPQPHSAKPTPPASFEMAEKKTHGTSCSLLNEILSETVRVLNDEIRLHKIDDGACLNVCAITKDAIKCINVGDSRALVVAEFPFSVTRSVVSESEGGRGKLTVPLLKKYPQLKSLLHPLLLQQSHLKHRSLLSLPLSFDHKPSNTAELIRIKESGGWVSLDRRVDGKLATARSVGDIELQPEVSGEGDTFERARQSWKEREPKAMSKTDKDNCWNTFLSSLTPHPLNPFPLAPRQLMSPVSLPTTPPSPVTNFPIQPSPSILGKIQATPPKPRTPPTAPEPTEEKKKTKEEVKFDASHFHSHRPSDANLFAFSSPHCLQTDTAVVIGCDGVFDVLTSQHVADIIHTVLLHFTTLSTHSSKSSSSNHAPLITQLDPQAKGYVAQKCAVAIKTAALALLTQDNVSVIVVLL